MAYGKTIELFLVNGTADSLITAELSNWNGKAIKIPRLELAKCNREDITQAGVYFLFCKEDDGTDSVYIGESENVKDRLVQHIRDNQADREKFHWNTAVIFIGRDLNKASIRYLENKFVEQAKLCKRYLVLTKNTYQNTVMKESQKAVMDEFISNAKVLINVLGYKVLEPLVQTTSSEISNDEDLLFINIGNEKTYAAGKVTNEGFVVLKGAKINEKVSEKSVRAGIVKLRHQYLTEKKIVDNVTSEDLLFSSATSAGCFVLGYSVSGPATWKNKYGKSLKDIEQEATEN